MYRPSRTNTAQKLYHAAHAVSRKLTVFRKLAPGNVKVSKIGYDNK